MFCGIGGFRLGLEQAGHVHAQSAEWEPFPRSVYGARFGALPDWSDVREIQADQIEGGPDALWAGGFPCQDASSAGAGLGLLGGKRSSLVFRILGLAAVARPEWIFLENVPGLLVRGRGFDRLLGILARLGYGFCWRTLDAQFFGVAQRRRRVFLLACLGARTGMRRAARVLLEPASVRRDSPTREEEGAGVARCLAASAGDGGAEGSRDELIAKPLLSHAGRQDEESETFIPSVSPTRQRSAGHHGHSSPRGDGSTPLVAGYQCHGSNVGPMGTLTRGNGCVSGGVPFVAGFNTNASSGDTTGYAPGLSVPVRANDPPGVVIPFNAAQVTHPENRNRCEPGEPAHTLASSGVPESIAEASGAWVRRLTPRECERLQGFPDDWTAVPGASNSARYKALGNAVAVPVVAWIAGRLAGAAL